jgi:hypothetical protein|tara:strand:- start:1258 stop:1551 length:294 start_codon:yes stop_codon:yes gene_type:complete
MIEIDTTSTLGSIGVVTTEFKGQTPEFWAERCTEKICGISDNAEPHIRQQAEAYKLAIYSAILYYIKQAINSQVVTMKNVLDQQGHVDIAKILKELN